jgi:molybdenum-dependent DNA-binding transcriptional regulator ModE
MELVCSILQGVSLSLKKQVIQNEQGSKNGGTNINLRMKDFVQEESIVLKHIEVLVNNKKLQEQSYQEMESEMNERNALLNSGIEIQNP